MRFLVTILSDHRPVQSCVEVEASGAYEAAKGRMEQISHHSHDEYDLLVTSPPTSWALGGPVGPITGDASARRFTYRKVNRPEWELV